MMKPLNQVQISFPSNSVNEGFARAAVSAFLAQLDPTVADLSDIKTAVSEAVTNAIVHGYRDSLGTVYITVKLFPEGKAVVRVRDKGRGIPAEELARVTEPFYMVDRSRARAQNGSGFGLALCERIARLHGGALAIESEAGKGTAVSFALALAPAGEKEAGE